MKDKLKSPLTGSKTEDSQDSSEKVLEKPDSWSSSPVVEIKSIDQKVSPEEIEEILQSLLDADWSDDIVQEMCTPSYMLSLGKDVEYLYSVSRKTFVPVKNNTEVVPIDSPSLNAPPGLLKNYFSVNNEIFDIDPEKVVCIGWN